MYIYIKRERKLLHIMMRYYLCYGQSNCLLIAQEAAAPEGSKALGQAEQGAPVKEVELPGAHHSTGSRSKSIRQYFGKRVTHTDRRQPA